MQKSLSDHIPLYFVTFQVLSFSQLSTIRSVNLIKVGLAKAFRQNTLLPLYSGKIQMVHINPRPQDNIVGQPDFWFSFYNMKATKVNFLYPAKFPLPPPMHAYTISIFPKQLNLDQHFSFLFKILASKNLCFIKKVIIICEYTPLCVYFA